VGQCSLNYTFFYDSTGEFVWEDCTSCRISPLIEQNSKGSPFFFAVIVNSTLISQHSIPFLLALFLFFNMAVRDLLAEGRGRAKFKNDSKKGGLLFVFMLSPLTLLRSNCLNADSTSLLLKRRPPLTK
jgi:hypothetical protein